MWTRIIFLFLFIAPWLLQGQESGITHFGQTKGVVYDMCFSKDCTLFIVPEGKVIHVYDFKSQQLKYTLEGGHSNDILAVDISPDGTKIVSGGKDSSVVIWNLEDRNPEDKISFHLGTITSVKFNPKMNTIAYGSTDNSVVIYDINTRQVVHKLEGHSGDVTTLDFNSTGEVLVTSGEDRLICFWDTKSGKILSQLNDCKAFVRQIKFNQAGNRLIAVGDGGFYKIYKTENISQPKLLKEGKFGLNWLTCADYHPDNETYAFAGINGKLKWLTGFGEYTKNVGKPVYRVLFVPGKGNQIFLVVATNGNGVMLVDTSK